MPSNKLTNIRWNLPNILSMYRLCMFPAILVFILLGKERAFILFFSINLITDIADGFIARRFNMQTPEGAVLDSIADVGSYILAIAGICKFHSDIFSDYGYWLLAFVALFIIASVIPFIKFGRPSAGLHLYSAKIAGYFQGIFLFLLFIHGMLPLLFYTAMITGYYAELEGTVINLVSKKPILNARTIFHCIKTDFRPTEL